jgi:NitT/TauT family transport system substrate-binding protein
MRAFTAFGGVALAAALAAAPVMAQDLPVLRADVQASGTVAWELDTIVHYGLDTANGFRLEMRDVAGSQAAQVAMLGGETDMIVSDWLWVARERAAGHDMVFVPYSKAVGGLMVTADSPVRSLADLKGRKVGIAGGPVDKSWLILRAYAQQTEGLDLAAETEQVFGAPPLIMEAALSGEVDAAINFWHFGAKMEAAGMRTVITVAEAATALGLDADTPLLGYVVRGEVLAERPEVVAGLAAASKAAKEKLATDPAAWDRLRERMNAADDAQFEALKAGFLAGTPSGGAVSVAAADKMLKLMADLGGAELVGDLTALPEGVFYSAGY